MNLLNFNIIARVVMTAMESYSRERVPGDGITGLCGGTVNAKEGLNE